MQNSLATHAVFTHAWTVCKLLSFFSRAWAYMHARLREHCVCVASWFRCRPLFCSYFGSLLSMDGWACLSRDVCWCMHHAGTLHSTGAVFVGIMLKLPPVQCVYVCSSILSTSFLCYMSPALTLMWWVIVPLGWGFQVGIEVKGSQGSRQVMSEHIGTENGMNACS